MTKIKTIIIALLLLHFNLSNVNAGVALTNKPDDGQRERAYLVKSLIRIADPVLNALSKNELKRQMPVEASIKGRENYTYLEAFGRLLAGLAPWLELGPDDTA